MHLLISMSGRRCSDLAMVELVGARTAGLRHAIYVVAAVLKGSHRRATGDARACMEAGVAHAKSQRLIQVISLLFPHSLAHLAVAGRGGPQHGRGARASSGRASCC